MIIVHQHLAVTSILFLDHDKMEFSQFVSIKFNLSWFLLRSKEHLKTYSTKIYCSVYEVMLVALHFFATLTLT